MSDDLSVDEEVERAGRGGPSLVEELTADEHELLILEEEGGKMVDGFLVTFSDAISDEDAQRLSDAVSLMKGVIDVRQIHRQAETALAEVRARNRMVQDILSLLTEGGP